MEIHEENSTNDRQKHELPPPSYFRFTPNDDELVHLLRKKIADEPIPHYCPIREIDLFKYHPKALAERFPREVGNTWYFFTPTYRKYTNSRRPNRTVGNGFWKAKKGVDRSITDKGKTIGFKKTLVFYRGKPRGATKTNWMMHEYRVHQARNNASSNHMLLERCVLCKVLKSRAKTREWEEENDDMEEEDGDTQENYGGDTQENYGRTTRVAEVKLEVWVKE